MALELRARTLPGVSAPSRVVRSTMRIARSSAHALAVVLMDRVPRDAARASAPTWSTPGRPWRNRRRDASDAKASARWPGSVEDCVELAVELAVAVTLASIGAGLRLRGI